MKILKYHNDSVSSPDTRTKYTYDELYRVASVAATTNTGSALSASYTYTQDNLTKIETGTTTYNFTYGNFSLRTAVTAGSRSLASYTYDTSNRLTKLTYGNGDYASYTYDSYGRVSGETYEDSDTVTYLYDNDGSLGAVKDSSSGTTTSFFYDLAGRLIGTRRTGGNGEHSVAYVYNSKNQLVRHKETFDNTTRTVYYGYDSYDRLKSITEGSSKETYAYDAFGRLSTSTLTHVNTEVMKETYGYRGTSTTTTGQISTLTVTTPGSYGASYSYAYDINGNIKTVTDSDGTTTYVYDTANQLIRENNQAAGKTWVYTYDNGGNILSRTEYAYTTADTPTGALDTVTYVYGNSNWGDLLTKHDGKTVNSDTNGNMTAYGKLRKYTWEHGRELSTLTQGAPIAIVKQPKNFKGLVGDVVKFSVTVRGEGITYQWQVSTNGGTSWGNSSCGGYNTANASLLLAEHNPGYLYRCKVTDSAGNVVYSEPGEIILAPIVIDSQPQHFYGETGDTVKFSVTARGEGLTYRWQVSTNGGTSWSSSSCGGYNTPNASLLLAEHNPGYLYRCKITDSSGNILFSQPGEIRLESGLYITTQPEDFTGRVGDTVRMSVAAHGTGLTYRWQASTNGGTTWNNSSAGGYNTANMSVPLSETNPGYLYRCKVTDSAGNVAYSEPGKIILATETWQYTYDADGLRTKATNGYNTYEYTYDGGKLTSMTVDGEVLYLFYDGSGKPLCFVYNGDKYYYATNLQGDVVAIVNAVGNTRVEYTYDAWGNILSITGTYADTIGELNPLRYRGYVYDQPTGQYYLQSRYYDPSLGRFINADVYTSTGQGLLGNNMFAYCGNNPVVRIDESGKFFFTILGAIVGAASGALDSLMMGGSPEDIAKGALAGAVSGAISGAGVDIGVAVTAATGGAGAGAGCAIAGVFGAAGAAVGTGISTDWEADPLDYAASALVGGMTNMVSFGLAPMNGEIAKGTASQIIKGIMREGMNDLAMNVTTGAIVAAGATWVTRTVTNDYHRTKAMR